MHISRIIFYVSTCIPPRDYTQKKVVDVCSESGEFVHKFGKAYRSGSLHNINHLGYILQIIFFDHAYKWMEWIQQEKHNINSRQSPA